MGSRQIRSPLRTRKSPREGRTLALILIGVGMPMFLGFLLVARDTRPDLSDLRSMDNFRDNDPLPLGWAALGQWSRDGAWVRMLGYMMDGSHFSNDGSPTAMFILLPNAGHFLHPAHRDPDEMVEVWPRRGTVVFKDRQLVWVTGRFERLRRNARDERAFTPCTMRPSPPPRMVTLRNGSRGEVDRESP